MGAAEDLGEDGAMSGLVFHYAVTPRSFPCGGAGGAAAVTLTVTVSNQTGSAQGCTAIQFTFPKELTANDAAPLAGTPWGIASQGDGVFVASPQPPATGIGAGDAIGFLFSNVVPATTPATVELAIEETSGATAELPLTLTAPQLGITEFTATSVQVTPHAAVTLSWNSSDASGCRLSWDRGTYPGASQDAYTDHPPETTTYTLTASGTGEPVQAQLTVTVETPQILSFGATPSEVALNGTVTLAWETLHAQSCELRWAPESGEGWRHAVAVDEPGTTISLPISGQYTLAATGVGRTVTQPEPLLVGSVAVDRFSASPDAIVPGGEATLTWATEWATAVSIEPDIGAVHTSGAKTVTPTAETTYTLTAQGQNPMTKTATVPVYPLITALALWQNVGSRYIPATGGGQIGIGWASSGAASATITGAGSVKPEYGYAVVPIPGSGAAITVAFTTAAGATASVRIDAQPQPNFDGGVAAYFYAFGQPLNLPGSTLATMVNGTIPLLGSAMTAAGVSLSFGNDAQWDNHTSEWVSFAIGQPPANAGSLWEASYKGPGEPAYYNWTCTMLPNAAPAPEPAPEPRP